MIDFTSVSRRNNDRTARRRNSIGPSLRGDGHRFGVAVCSAKSDLAMADCAEAGSAERMPSLGQDGQAAIDRAPGAVDYVLEVRGQGTARTTSI